MASIVSYCNPVLPRNFFGEAVNGKGGGETHNSPAYSLHSLSEIFPAKVINDRRANASIYTMADALKPALLNVVSKSRRANAMVASFFASETGFF